MQCFTDAGSVRRKQPSVCISSSAAADSDCIGSLTATDLFCSPSVKVTFHRNKSLLKISNLALLLQHEQCWLSITIYLFQAKERNLEISFKATTKEECLYTEVKR